MAFRRLEPETPLTFDDPYRAITVQINSSGRPAFVFSGPDDWVHYRYAPPQWKSRRGTPATDPMAETIAKVLGPNQNRHVVVGADAQGNPGWDPDWVLLMALSNDEISITAFRELARQANPWVAHPSARGPGQGLPLPFAIVASKNPPVEKMRLLACLPVEILSRNHAGQSLTATVASSELMAVDEPGNRVLLAWLMRLTGQPFPLGAVHLEEKLPLHANFSRAGLQEMLASGPIREAFIGLCAGGKKAWNTRVAAEIIENLLVREARVARANEAAPDLTAPVRSRVRP
jgi:hypothetical protein